MELWTLLPCKRFHSRYSLSFIPSTETELSVMRTTLELQQSLSETERNFEGQLCVLLMFRRSKVKGGINKGWKQEKTWRSGNK